MVIVKETEAKTMGLGTWESYLANHIEGFFNKKFSSSLEAVELMNGLEREPVSVDQGTGS